MEPCTSLLPTGRPQLTRGRQASQVMILRRLLTGGLALTLGCAPLPPASPVIQGRWPGVASHPAIGCWALTAPGIDTLYLRPPGLVRFTDSASWQAGSAPHSFVLVPGAGVRRRRSLPRFASWTPGDSATEVWLSWSDGYVGVNITAVIGHDSLAGHGYSYTDAQALTAHVPVTGIRVPCDSVAL